MRIAIIGGGISGLSTAFYIKRSRPDWEVSVFERRPYLGGTMHTRNVDGFLFETGSNGFLSNKPHTLDLVKDSGADALLMKSNDAARIRFIYTDRLHRLPDNPKAFLGTRLLTLGGKLRVLAEVLIPPKRGIEDETLQSFGYRRVGKQFTDIFLNAMSAGVFGSTPEVLSVNAAFPAVVRLEQDYGGLFKGMVKKKKKQAGPGGVLMSFSGGVGSFVEHLAGCVQGEKVVGTAVTGLRRADNGYLSRPRRANRYSTRSCWQRPPMPVRSCCVRWTRRSPGLWTTLSTRLLPWSDSATSSWRTRWRVSGC